MFGLFVDVLVPLMFLRFPPCVEVLILCCRTCDVTFGAGEVGFDVPVDSCW